MLTTMVWFIGLFLTASEAPSLHDIDRIRAQFWCDSCPGGRFRVRVEFNMKIDQPDPALGTAYFPVSDLTGRIVNLTRWTQEVTRGGASYRAYFDHSNILGYQGKVPGAFQQTYLYNKHNAWKFEPGYKGAVQDDGHSRGTRLLQDYYGDMIGAELGGISRSLARTVPSGTDEPYDINKLIGTGLYHLAGTEDVGDEPCVVIERSHWDRVWLATRKNFVVVRREWRWAEGGPLKRRISNRDWHEVASGVWLPFQGQMEVMGHPTTRPGQLVGVLTATVREATAAVSDEEFEPHFPKGTRVLDLETGLTFQAGLSPAELAEQSKRKLQLSLANPELARFAHKPKRWWEQPWVWLAGGLTLIAAAVGTWARRRLR